jgi:hypothetical protein
VLSPDIVHLRLRKGVGLYEFLLFVHVLAAVIWVGGGIALNIVGTRLANASGPEAMSGFARQVEFIGQRVFAPVSGILFLVGVFMTLYSAITGAAILGPLSGKTGKLIAERGADDPQVGANIKKLFMFGRVEALVMILVIAAMTMKPTLG